MTKSLNMEMIKSPSIIDVDLSVGSFYAAKDMMSSGWKTICFAIGGDVPECDINVELIDGSGNNVQDITKSINWILEQWENNNKVFVCCRFGMSRSPSIAAAALAANHRCEWLSNGLKQISYYRQFISPRDDMLSDTLLSLMQIRKVSPNNIG